MTKLSGISDVGWQLQSFYFYNSMGVGCNYYFFCFLVIGNLIIQYFYRKFYY